MKRLFTFLSVMLIAATSWAGYYTVVSPYNTQGGEFSSTVVVAEFTTNEGYGYANYEIGAFVDGDCRVTAVPVVPEGSRLWRVTLRVPSTNPSADNGKAITFKVFNSATQCEYDLTSSTDVTFQEGDNTVNTTLTLTAATRVTLEDIRVSLGTNGSVSVDLTDYLKPQPDGASLPLNVTPTWRLTDTTIGSISGNTLTATKPTTGSTYSVVCQRLTATGNLYISQPATSIVINRPTEITFRMGEDDNALNQLLSVSPDNQHYTVTPSNTTDQVSWEIGDRTIIAPTADLAGYTMLKAGTTTVWPKVTRSDGTFLTPSDPSAITVTVVQPVKSIVFQWSSQNPNRALVGENVYGRLASLVKIEPETAEDQAFTFKVTQLSDAPTQNAYTQTENSIVFNVTGYFEVQVISHDNPSLDNAKTHIKFQVENPARELTFQSEVIDILSTGEQDFVTTVARQVNDNITLGPDGWQTASGTISVSGTALTVNQQGTLVSTEKGAYVDVTAANNGSSTVTVKLEWNDYSSYNGSAQSITTASLEKSFTVNIAAGLQKFAVTHTPGADGTGTLRFETVPADVTFSADDILITLTNGGYPDTWTPVTISSRSADAKGITVNYTAALPGNVTVSAKSAATGISYQLTGTNNEGVVADFEGFNVPATYSFNSGWQWRSNSYGDLGNQYDEFFNQTFLESFYEARTQTALLINDDLWGLFSDGDFTIGQAQCYKIRMNAPATTTLSFGTTPAATPASTVTVALYKGWTWVGSPYFYNRLLENALTTDGAALPQGTVIKSKEGGFVEWDGRQWVGSLKKIEKNQGYLVYCPEENYSLNFVAEATMAQGDEGNGAGARGLSSRPWRYDATPYANNMSMVAVLENVSRSDSYSVGAFVNGECRGEGVSVGGRLFITVHANNGELVSFRLHNETTGEYYDISETVKCQQMVGSLTAPVALTAPALITGINTATAPNGSAAGAIYDLTGRQNPNARLTIRRTADGKVVKILK